MCLFLSIFPKRFNWGGRRTHSAYGYHYTMDKGLREWCTRLSFLSSSWLWTQCDKLLCSVYTVISLSYHLKLWILSTLHFYSCHFLIAESTEIWYLGVRLLDLWTLFSGRMWKYLDIKARTALEYCKQSLIGHYGRSKWNQNSKRKSRQ